MEQTYLTLDGMLTFVGLIVAAFQFLKPRYLLIWRLSNNFTRYLAVSLLAVGYLMPLTSILIPHNRHRIWNDLGLAQFLQISGFIAITLGLVIIIYLYTHINRSHLVVAIPRLKITRQNNWPKFRISFDRRKIITRHSASKFYDTTSKFLIRGHMEEVVEITHDNLPALVRSALYYNPDHSKIDPELTPHKKSSRKDGSDYAFEILYQILTDEAVMRHICTDNYPLLHDLVILENKLSSYGPGELAEVLYKNLMEHLLLNQDSLLYTQRDTDKGAARFVNVYDLLTNPHITEHHIIMPAMSTYHISKTDIPIDKYVDVLLSLLRRMVNSYKQQPGSDRLLTNIRLILDQLIGDNGVTRRLAYDETERKNYTNDIIKSTAYRIVSQIENSLTKGLMFEDSDPEVFQQSPAEGRAINTTRSKDQKTLTGLFAHKVYQLIEDMTILQQDTSDPDGNLFRQADSYITLISISPAAKRYKQLLWKRMFDKAVDGKLEKNSTNIEGYYPNILRFIMHYLIPFDDNQLKHNSQPIVRLKHIMSHELKDALLSGKTMANGKPMKDVLLSHKVQPVINKTKQTVRYYYIDGHGKKKLISLTT